MSVASITAQSSICLQARGRRSTSDGEDPGQCVPRLAGASTHNCIAQAAADAFGHNLRVIYAAEATASENPEAAAAVQDILCHEYRQQILPIAEILDRLMTPRKGQEVLS
ncbi:MAG: hypothetical protein ABWX85_12475 [Arthrobacter sp.]